MKYDFDRVIARSGTNSVKWDKQFLKEHFKTDDILPLWVTDMDVISKNILSIIKDEKRSS